MKRGLSLLPIFFILVLSGCTQTNPLPIDENYFCESDDECVMINIENINEFECCYFPDSIIDYSLDKWVAVNEEYLNMILENNREIRRQNCGERTCPLLEYGPEIISMNYQATCVNNRCEKTPFDRCDAEPETGPCKAAFTKYYFNKTEGKCVPFTWGGCQGVVPFSDYTKCLFACEV